VLELIKSELRTIKEKYATPRLTDILPDASDINIEDLIANKGLHHHADHRGYISAPKPTLIVPSAAASGVVGMNHA